MGKACKPIVKGLLSPSLMGKTGRLAKSPSRMVVRLYFFSSRVKNIWVRLPG